jgi:hypothetical protein
MKYDRNKKAIQSSTPGAAPQPVPQSASGVGGATNISIRDAKPDTKAHKRALRKRQDIETRS